jgi:hypothetical protein
MNRQREATIASLSNARLWTYGAASGICAFKGPSRMNEPHAEHIHPEPAGEFSQEEPRLAPLHRGLTGRPMEKVRDDDYPYRGFLGCEAVCHLRVYLPASGDIDPANPVVMVATELGCNPGTSITNMAEHLAQEIRELYGLGPAEVLWIEHYNTHSYGPGSTLPEEFSHVTFSLDAQGHYCSPKWRYLSRTDAEGLAGEPL